MTKPQSALIYAIPIAIELLGIFMIAVGVAVEISTGADIGHNIITLGSAIVSTGSIIFAKIYKPRQKSNREGK